jgi:hypothetical protein
VPRCPLCRDGNPEVLIDNQRGPEVLIDDQRGPVMQIAEDQPILQPDVMNPTGAADRVERYSRTSASTRNVDIPVATDSRRRDRSEFEGSPASITSDAPPTSRARLNDADNDDDDDDDDAADVHNASTTSSTIVARGIEESVEAKLARCEAKIIEQSAEIDKLRAELAESNAKIEELRAELLERTGDV